MELTYFGSLIIFLCPPLIVLTFITIRDLRRLRTKIWAYFQWPPYVILCVHIFLAVLYTTPWDNFLVATGVWWYENDLVSGITIWFVPLEEYLFFILQTLITGLGVMAIWNRYEMHNQSHIHKKDIRKWAMLIIFIIWAISTYLLIFGEPSLNYLTLILSWALIPILIQVAFGGDILWTHRNSLIFTVSMITIYLWIMDAISISSGIWTIDPAQTTGLGIGPLPLEEMLFFLMTNLIISFGVTLMLSPQSKARLNSMINNLRWPFKLQLTKTKDI